MPCLHLSNYASFLNTQLRIHVFLSENHAKMQGFLEALLARPWGTELVAEAYLKKLLHVLKQAETMNQKESSYLLDRRASLQWLAQAEIRVIGSSNIHLILNGQNNVHLFLEERYLRVQCFIAMMSSHVVFKNKRGAQRGMESFSKYLALNQSINRTVLEALKKITSGWKKLCLTDQRAVDVPGSAQFYNLMTYCHRWGRRGHDA